VTTGATKRERKKRDKGSTPAQYICRCIRSAAAGRQGLVPQSRGRAIEWGRSGPRNPREQERERLTMRVPRPNTWERGTGHGTHLHGTATCSRPMSCRRGRRLRSKMAESGRKGKTRRCFRRLACRGGKTERPGIPTKEAKREVRPGAVDLHSPALQTRTVTGPGRRTVPRGTRSFCVGLAALAGSVEIPSSTVCLSSETLFPRGPRERLFYWDGDPLWL
jgi:hypothetical protein